MNLSNKVVTSINHAPIAAGSSDVTDCEVVDMAGYEGARFIVQFGAITSGAATSLKVQQAAAQTSSTALTSGADLEGSSITVGDTDDSKLFIIDVYKPRERYLQLHILRATQNAVVDAVLVEQYGAKKLPVTQNADVDTVEIHASPAEGTA